MTFYIPYIGQALLLFILATCFLTLALPLSLKSLKRLYATQVMLVGSAFVLLLYAHLISDFSLLTVVQHSHTQKPLLYKIAGTWGHHEGSFLFWTFLFTLVGGLAFRRSLNAEPFYVYSALTTGFILFMLMTCDPFVPILDIPLEGKDLNPLLQDPLLAIHPPFLYLGYISTSVLFTLSLINSNNTKLWRQWCLISWISLTLGLALGSFWAYYELGWGGWWFWDPVENVALIPWLLLTSLLHTLQLKTPKNLNAIKTLSFFCFASCLCGTYIVRSGLLTSVHSFAIAPERGLFLGILIIFILGPSLYILLKQKQHSSLPSQTGSDKQLIRMGAGLLTLGAAIVALGTIYPLLMEFFHKSITVGAPYFKATFIPIMLPLLALMALHPWLKRTSFFLLQEGYTPLILSAFISLSLWFYNPLPLFNVCIFFLSVWLLLSLLWFFSYKIYLERKIPLKKISMAIAHFGLAVSALGMVLSISFEKEELVALKVGESATFANQTITLKEMQPHKGANFMSQRAILETKDKKYLTPEKRFYWTQSILHNETSIQSGLFDHFYVALGDRYDDDSWSFRFYDKPWINLIWMGAALMAIGGLLGLLRRRLGWAVFLLYAFGNSMTPFPTHALNYHEQLSLTTLEIRAKELGDQLICPTCVGQTLNDSEAEEAQLLREIIREQLMKGYSDQQVLDWFVDRYGNRVLLNPPLLWETMLLWGLPWILFCLFLMKLMGQRRRTKPKLSNLL